MHNYQTLSAFFGDSSDLESPDWMEVIKDLFQNNCFQYLVLCRVLSNILNCPGEGGGGGETFVVNDGWNFLGFKILICGSPEKCKAEIQWLYFRYI